MKAHREAEHAESTRSSFLHESAPGRATLADHVPSGRGLQLKRLARDSAVTAPSAHGFVDCFGGAVQRKAGADGGGGEAQIHQAAQAGIAGGGGPLPHLALIQQSFGRHDVSGVSAHVGGAAAAASEAMGAEAYATGDHVAFRGAPDLHTAAHEAAHVVQQRGGVQLKGGIGASGDRYEHHADAVADAVVAGRSAEGLLDQMAGGTAASGGAAIQRQDAAAPADPAAAPADPDLALIDKGEQAITDGRTQFHWSPEESTDKRARAFVFDDADAEQLLDHLINKWDGSPEARLETPSVNSGVPLWISKFRARALATRTAPLAPGAKPMAKMPEAPEKERRQAIAARKLCDAVVPKTAAEQFREDLVAQSDKTIGKVVVSTATIAETRHPTKPGKDGKIPKAMPNYTSCIDTVGNELGSTKVEKGAKRPTLGGIGTMQVQNDPAFRRFTPGSQDRPRVGDVAIYAKDKNGQPNFQHINVIRRMEAPAPDGTERWYTVDGGQESTAVDQEVPTAEKTATFDPKTGAYGDRMLYGWVDVEQLYNNAQKK